MAPIIDCRAGLLSDLTRVARVSACANIAISAALCKSRDEKPIRGGDVVNHTEASGTHTSVWSGGRSCEGRIRDRIKGVFPAEPFRCKTTVCLAQKAFLESRR